MARSCVAYGTSSSATLGPIFNAAGRVEEATRRPTDDVATWDEECYGWFEQSGIVAFTWLGPKDSSTRWLDTLKDMAMNREQWRSCQFLSGQIVWRWLLDRPDRNFCLLAKMVYFYFDPISCLFYHPLSEIMIARKRTLSTCCVAAAVVWSTIVMLLMMMVMNSFDHNQLLIQFLRIISC